MIYIGTDIIDIKRIRINIDSHPIKFLNKIFTEKEIEYCKSKKDPAVHFAGKFAGKEAVKKAILSSGILDQLSMKEIEINSLGGPPKVKVSNFKYRINISISHTKKTAISTAIFLHD